MLIGYARVSTVDQNLAVQRDALIQAGCDRIFTEQLSGAVATTPGPGLGAIFKTSGFAGRYDRNGRAAAASVLREAA